MAFAKFMATPAGRAIRIAVGLVLILVGLSTDGIAGWIIALVGALPFITGILNVCLIGRLLGAPMSGRDV